MKKYFRVHFVDGTKKDYKEHSRGEAFEKALESGRGREEINKVEKLKLGPADGVPAKAA
jgi:hypothetical protein